MVGGGDGIGCPRGGRKSFALDGDNIGVQPSYGLTRKKEVSGEDPKVLPEVAPITLPNPSGRFTHL